MKYNIVTEHGKPTSATVFHRGRVYVAATDHPNFPAIVEALEQGRPPREVVDLFDASSAIARGFRAARKLLSKTLGDFKDGMADQRDLNKVIGNIEVKDKKLYYDGEQVNGALADVILRFHNEGNKDYLPMVRFFGKVMSNPNPNSREHLYAWMKNKSFQVHEDGDIIAYKGVEAWRDKADRAIGFASTTAGEAEVNGKTKRGRIRQRVGDVVSMDRKKVTFNPNQACSAGLHVGTWEFARGYGSRMIEVKIDPADVVSVPNDSGHQKMRVCRYTVVKEITSASVRLLRPESTTA